MMPSTLVLRASGEIPFGLWGIPLYFLGLWAFISLMLSFIGGWRSLAKAYPYHGQSTGTLLRFRSAAFRFGTSYRNCVTFGVSPAGLYIEPFFLFRLFHPPMFIPWHDVQNRPFDEWFFSGVEFVTSAVPQVPIRVSLTLAWELSSESNHGFELKSAPLGL
jgi:hypothetical protein